MSSFGKSRGGKGTQVAGGFRGSLWAVGRMAVVGEMLSDRAQCVVAPGETLSSWKDGGGVVTGRVVMEGEGSFLARGFQSAD